ncbi:hypothetical protein BDZ45DRAFT_670903, partial [Acephala macrosclerotiorum]
MSSGTGFSFGALGAKPSTPRVFEKPSTSSTSEMSSGTGFSFGALGAKPSTPRVFEKPSTSSTSEMSSGTDLSRKPPPSVPRHPTTLMEDLEKARDLLNFWSDYPGLVIEALDSEKI